MPGQLRAWPFLDVASLKRLPSAPCSHPLVYDEQGHQRRKQQHGHADVEVAAALALLKVVAQVRAERHPQDEAGNGDQREDEDRADDDPGLAHCRDVAAEGANRHDPAFWG